MTDAGPPAPNAAPPATPSFPVERDPRLRLLIPMIVAVAFLMEQLDATIITTALPDMARSLGTTPVRMNLAVTTYVLALAVFIPVSGWFADRFGARRVFALALLVFTVGSMLCGLADSLPTLVATRALQGLGGAMMTPVGRLILLRSFPRSQFVTAMTYMTLPAIAGPVIGPLLGGVLTTYASWRWIFFVNLPFGLLGILLALRYVEDGRDASPSRFDTAGFLLVGGGVALLQFGVESLGRPVIAPGEVCGVFGTGAVLLALFARHAARVPNPAVDLGLFRLRSFAVGTLAGGLCRVALNGPPFLLPLMLQVGFGLSPVASGSLTFLSSAGAVLVRVVSARLLRRFGFGWVLGGSALASSVALAGFACLGADTPRWIIGASIFAFGLVRATQFMTSNTLSYADLPASKLSRATSLGGILQQLSVSFGVSLGALALSLVGGHGTALTSSRFHLVFLLLAVLPVLSLPAFGRLRPEDGLQVSRRTLRRDAIRPSG